jgi:short subunit dehydrogenase-like uncharacterized protein
VAKEQRQDRPFDVVVWGATGFTGSLVAEYLYGRYGVDGDLRWAIGGRSEEKLAGLRDRLGAGERLPLLVGDSRDSVALAAIAGQTRVVCSTVGPFARYGSELVEACATAGTHYCDITGEVQWMRRMIDAHEDKARATGARIVHACGFDSIPSDLGTLFIQRSMQAEERRHCDEVKLRVRKMKGAFSGGTVASLLNALDEAARDPAARRALGHPYSLNPAGEQSGPDGGDQRAPVYDADFVSWTAPFVMASVNTRVVRRSNAVMGFPYGRDFRYSEAVTTGAGTMGWTRAVSMTAALGAFVGAASIGPARRLMNRLFLPQPGEGPDEAAREAGSFDLRLFGRAANGRTIRGRVTGDRDPGYGATCRMLGESAVCLATEGDSLPVAGGFWTPASCMGDALIPRLEASAGMRFERLPD